MNGDSNLKALQVEVYIVKEYNQISKQNTLTYALTSQYINYLMYFLNAIHMINSNEPLLNRHELYFQKWLSGPMIPAVYNFWVSDRDHVIKYPDSDTRGFIDQWLPRLLKYPEVELKQKLINEPQFKNTDRSKFHVINVREHKDFPTPRQVSNTDVAHNEFDNIKDNSSTLVPDNHQYEQSDSDLNDDLDMSDKVMPIGGDSGMPFNSLANAYQRPKFDAAILPIPDKSANYDNEETVQYWKKHQFWQNENVSPLRKAIQKAIKDVRIKNPDQEGNIKRAIKNGIIVDNLHVNRDMTEFTFDATRVQNKLVKSNQYKINYNPLAESYTLIAKAGSKNQWIGDTLIGAICGVDALDNIELCRKHNQILQRTTEQNDLKYLNKPISHSKRNSLVLHYAKLGNYFLAKEIINNSLNGTSSDDTISLDFNTFKKIFYTILARDARKHYFSNDVNSTKLDSTNTEAKKQSLDNLKQMIGLDGVKHQIHDYINEARVAKREAQLGRKTNLESLNMIFMGNPGTGKTVVARLVGRILSAYGITQNNKFVECSAKDLIGKYAGQTAPKTASLFKQALGGVLFIDEAYNLAHDPEGTSNDNLYKDDAVSELLRLAENYRGKIVIIMAGYTSLMQNMLRYSNPGLKSRFSHKIIFPDYSYQDLFKILKLHAIKDNHCKISANNYGLIKYKLLPFINQAKKLKDNSNGRLVRNLLDDILTARDNRIGPKVEKMTLEQIDKAVTKDDIQKGFHEALKDIKNGDIQKKSNMTMNGGQEANQNRLQ